MYFSFNLVGVLSILTFSVKIRAGGGGWFLLNGKNLFSKDDESYLLTVRKLCHTQPLNISRGARSQPGYGYRK